MEQRLEQIEGLVIAKSAELTGTHILSTMNLPHQAGILSGVRDLN